MDLRTVLVILHALAASVGIGTVVITDYFVFNFLKDHKITKRESDTLALCSHVIWAALALLLLTGVVLVSLRPEMLASAKFQVKMVVVALLTLNGIVLNVYLTPRLRRIAFHAHVAPAKSLPDAVRKIAMASGAISFVSWLTAFVLGSLRSIPMSFAQGVGLYAGVLAVIALGASLTKKKRD